MHTASAKWYGRKIYKKYTKHKDNTMKNYKITVQYDGTRYKGWQVQKSTDQTIQGKLQNVLQTLAGHPVEVTGSGRTDAGVHARGQVANFHLDEHFHMEEIFQWLNRYLPDDIAVIAMEEVDERFHARYHAVEKTYQYRIHTGIVPNVFERRELYDYKQPLDIEKMKKAADLLCGTHDYTSFCGNRKFKKSAVRTVYRIDVEKTKDEIRLTYSGDGFLQNMIRILTGTLIEVGNGSRNPEEMTEILEAKDRSRAGYTAPPQGLTLLHVTYEKDW